MNESKRFPISVPTIALAFAAIHLTYEHFTGGVLSHHMLHNPDMPAISNWFELITIPLLGVILGLRVRANPSSKIWAGVPVSMLTPLLGAFIFGAAMALSFSFGAEIVTSILSIVMLAAALLFPVYRAEYILGFVTGMTFAFGGVLPLIVAMVLAALSFIVRYIINKVTDALRKRHT